MAGYSERIRTTRARTPTPCWRGSRPKRGSSPRGKLKIFLGASAGVGKTYAMLEAARARRADTGTWWPASSRPTAAAETEALLDGLEILPRKDIEYKGIRLAGVRPGRRRSRAGPGLILVDEMAHTNAPGSRHPKRWQDVKELLDSGIDVYTTLNIQHIESYNDIVAQITGVVMQETVPDAIVEQADSVELVDLPTRSCSSACRRGRSTSPPQAELAQRNFFKPGNLSALRELALRFTAEKVNRQVQAFKPTGPGADDVADGGEAPGARRARAPLRRASYARARRLASDAARRVVRPPRGDARQGARLAGREGPRYAAHAAGRETGRRGVHHHGRRPRGDRPAVRPRAQHHPHHRGEASPARMAGQALRLRLSTTSSAAAARSTCS